MIYEFATDTLRPRQVRPRDLANRFDTKGSCIYKIVYTGFGPGWN